ncbi:MAG: SH3 domain-containing protein [Methyloceanibacter sp.]
MSLLQIRPRAAQPTGVVRLSKDVANSNLREKPAHVPGAIEAALPLTPERLELIKAYAENSPRQADRVTASRIAQRFAPRPPAVPHADDPQGRVQAPLAAPFFALASGIHRLTAVLILVALLPNLTLAALWLGAIDMPWSKSATPASNLSSTPTQPLPVLSAPSALEARAGEHVSFPIALDGTDGVPPGSMVVIKGLPQGSRLSTGHRMSPTQWTLQPDDIGDLHLVLPAFASRESKLAIELVAPGDRIVADASTTLRLIADRVSAELAVREVESAPSEPQASDAEAQVTAAAQEPATAELAGATIAAAMDDATASIDAAPASSEVVPLPTRRPEPPKSDDADANWIKPTAYVNLRNAPSSTAGVVGVVAKGAKLRVVSRKRGWVQVNDPATSKSGWIYSGNAATTDR